MHVTVINPDNPFDSPAYDGPAREAHTVLAPGDYETTTPGLALLVMEGWSVAGAVVAIDLVHKNHPEMFV